jgi:sensor histidine kinase regulating citrate/malate metabolism
MQFFAEHAYAAIRTAQLFEQERAQVGALRRLVRTLEEQGHEHANRLQALSGLLALKEYEEAEEYLESLEVVHRRARGALGSRVRHPLLAGLLVAEASIAHQRGIELTVDPASRDVELPPSLSGTQLLTIVGNLLDNAFDAVADVEPARRRVWLSLSTDGTNVTIEVRDWGRGVAPEEERLIFERGISGKEDHAGVGLALVESAVSLAGGSIALERHDEGTSMIVTLPLV